MFGVLFHSNMTAALNKRDMPLKRHRIQSTSGTLMINTTD